MGEEKEISLEEAFTRLQETIENLERMILRWNSLFRNIRKVCFSSKSVMKLLIK